MEKKKGREKIVTIIAKIKRARFAAPYSRAFCAPIIKERSSKKKNPPEMPIRILYSSSICKSLHKLIPYFERLFYINLGCYIQGHDTKVYRLIFGGLDDE